MLQDNDYDDIYQTEAYREGYRAYHNDISRDDNPYDLLTEEEFYYLWYDGWMDAAWDD